MLRKGSRTNGPQRTGSNFGERAQIFALRDAAENREFAFNARKTHLLLCLSKEKPAPGDSLAERGDLNPRDPSVSVGEIAREFGSVLGSNKGFQQLWGIWSREIRLCSNPIRFKLFAKAKGEAGFHRT